MQDRMRRQREQMANNWSRDGGVRSQEGMSNIEHRSASSYTDLLSTTDPSVGSVL